MDFKKINIAIIFPCSWPFLPTKFFEGWIALRMPVGMKYSAVVSNRGRQDDMRNAGINEVLKYNEKFTHILFLDVDHIFHPNTIGNLVKRDVDIVNALSYRRGIPYEPIAVDYSNDKWIGRETWEEGELIDCDATGASSILIKIDVFKKMKNPWFQMNYKFKNGVISEDFAFCVKAKELGYKIYVDTSVPNKHLGELEVDHSTFLKYKNEINQKNN